MFIFKLAQISFLKLKKLYIDEFTNSPLFIQLIQELKNTVVEFRFLRQAEIIADELALSSDDPNIEVNDVEEEDENAMMC